MIIHLVFFSMQPESGGCTGEENARKLVDMLRSLPAAIPEIIELQAGVDFSRSDASFDVGLLTKFNSTQDLESYRVHPEHRKVIEFVKATTSRRAVTDFEV